MDIPPMPPILKTDPYTIPFFHDFMLFLKYLEKQPIKRTVTGAISLTDIKPLLEAFKDQERINEYKSYGWHLRREEELQFLTQIKIIAEVIYLTYKRKGFLYLSKNGQGFLKNIDTLTQYKNMVFHYWFGVNWGYFTPGGPLVNNLNFAERLQRVQKDIWAALLQKGEVWQDYKHFCLSLRDYFQLNQYITSDYDPEHDLLFHIRLVLFDRNLLRLGCVEVEKKPGKYELDQEIVRFRPTPLGLTAFHKALYENYL